jgi:hypothetical protein
MRVPILLHRELKAVLWIRIGFSADPDSDPVFLVNTDPDADPDPDPGFEEQKLKKNLLLKFFFLFVYFLMKNCYLLHPYASIKDV